jgi:hypothetical protein
MMAGNITRNDFMNTYTDDEPLPPLDIPTGFQWKGKTLQPFSMLRQVVWHTLRRGLWPSEPDGLSEYLGGALIMLWLCDTPDDEIRTKLAARNSAAMVFDAMAWGDANVKPGEQSKAIKLALDIFNDAHQEAFEAVSDDAESDHSGDDVGKPQAARGGA